MYWWCRYKRRYGLNISVRIFLSSRTMFLSVLRNILSSRAPGFNVCQMKELLHLDLSIAFWPFWWKKNFSVGLAIQSVSVNNSYTFRPLCYSYVGHIQYCSATSIKWSFWGSQILWEAGRYETSQFGKKKRNLYTNIQHITYDFRRFIIHYSNLNSLRF